MPASSLSLSLAGSPLALDAQGDPTVNRELSRGRVGVARPGRNDAEGASPPRAARKARCDTKSCSACPESNQFLILEIWKDQRALDAHNGAAHTKSFREQVSRRCSSRQSTNASACATMVAPLRQSRAAVYVVTHIDVPGTSRDAALELMDSFIDRTRSEPGNVRFDLVHQSNRTNHFTAIEAWADQKAADAHELAQHTRTFRRGITPLLGALYDQRWYRPLEVQP